MGNQEVSTAAEQQKKLSNNYKKTTTYCAQLTAHNGAIFMHCTWLRGVTQLQQALCHAGHNKPKRFMNFARIIDEGK